MKWKQFSVILEFSKIHGSANGIGHTTGLVSDNIYHPAGSQLLSPAENNQLGSLWDFEVKRKTTTQIDTP